VASDGELVRQAAAGETDAIEQLVRRWSARVLAVCRSRVHRADAAEDLAQESLLRALRGLGALAEPEKFGAWVCGIAHRTCLDWLKDVRRTEVSYESLADPPEASVRDEEGDNVERLMGEVAKLPLPYRETLMLYYAKDCTYEELAGLLGVSAATVNVRLTKARKMLREKLCAERESL
jgi:RNA polymerase sigma factor (sigma-70 family)